MKLDKRAVKKWLEGQKLAEKIIERERVKRLMTITQEESLRIYLEMKADHPDDPNRTDISPVTLAVLRATKKLAEMRGETDESF